MEARPDKLNLLLSRSKIDASMKAFAHVDFVCHRQKNRYLLAITTDGQPPDLACKAVRRWAKKGLPDAWLANLNYALLGLGDSNYSAYHSVPLKLDKILKGHGAKAVIPRGLADDQVGLELVVEPWISKLLGFLKEKSAKKEEFVIIDKAGSEDTIVKSDSTITFVDIEKSIEQVQQEIANMSDTVTLTKGSDKLTQESNLRVPKGSIEYLASTVSHEKFEDLSQISWQNNSKFPGQGSNFYEANVVGVVDTTGADISGVKEKLEIHLEVMSGHDSLLKYEPGDSFYFIIPNKEDEVDELLRLTKMTAISDQKLEISLLTNTERTNAQLPEYIPKVSTLRYIFTHCLDIRRTPGRPVLRILADGCQDECEKRRLLELCSTQGMAEFNKHVRSAGITLTDVLMSFPSCTPSVDRLIELLPRLIPRPYTVACHHSQWGNRLRFVYSIMTFTAEEGRQYERTGLATGFLKKLRIGDRVKMALKETSKFRLPPISMDTITDGYDIPLLMIAPGTGVAPFVSFLQKIQSLQKIKVDKKDGVKRYLLYGCRNLKKEFLFKPELKTFEQLGCLTKLFLCESRPDNNNKQIDNHHPYPKHVQDILLSNKELVVDFIKTENSRIYLCGDGIGMSKDIFECFVGLVMEGFNLDKMEAIKYVNEMKKQERYIEDVWS
uniref:5-methyltetrahydrofolate-homocysteine methyltransferase reductase n=1 Tax=Rhabditophanes sp. KR3021 TaxID=114890 RepID=A0AC35UG45_9BILA